MNSKRVRFYRILPTLMLGGIFIFSGCDKSNDVFNPDRIQEEAKKAFPVKNIDPNQTWETSAICNASVSVNEKTGGSYTIKVYTENPYNTNGNAFLLAKASVTDGQTVNFKFDIPAALQYVYVMKVNDKGFSSVIPVVIENSAMKTAFVETGTTRAAATRAGGGQFFVPEKPNDKTFPVAAPANCGDINKYYEKTNTIPYLLKEGTYNLGLWAGADVYIQGNVTINSVDVPASGSTLNFYLLPNATLTLKKLLDHSPNSIFSIGTGAKLIANEIIGESGSKFFNRGTITSPMIKLINAYFYNEGTIETDKVIFSNSNAKFCNASGGNLSVNSFSIVGDGHFLNETDAVVTCKGNTEVTCTNGSWENAGHYTTSTMKMYAWNKSIKNSCWLTVENKLEFYESGIFNESYIKCKDLYMQNTTINMAVNSLFEVTNEAAFQDNYNNKGFINSTTGADNWAIVKMGKAISFANHNWQDIAYVGKLYIACNDHFSAGNSNPIFKLENGAQLADANHADVSITSSQCTPGYNSSGGGDGGGDDKVQTYAYAFEDMVKTVGDYDFNDVVLYISTPIATGKENKKEIAVTLKAAGATKQIAVLFKNKGKTQTIFGNVHTALGVPDGTITNTGSTSAKATTQIIEVDENFSLTNDGDFYISVDKGEVHIPNFITDFKAGDVPYAIRIANANWKWAKEGTKITEAYLDFTTWAQDATQESNWYENPQDGKVME